MAFVETVKAHKTDIFMGVGIASGIAAIFFACKGTIKAVEVLDEHNKTVEDIKEASELQSEDYTEEDIKKDKIQCFKNTAIGMAKCYWPAFLLFALSVGLELSAYGQQKKSAAAYSAALTSLSGLFAKYRGRVRDELGEEKDRYFLYGYKKVTKQEEVIDEETGETKIVESTEEIIDIPGDMDSVGVLVLSRFNEDGTEYMYWDENPGIMINTLKAAEYALGKRQYASRSTLSVNDIRKHLCLKCTDAGQVWGKRYDPNDPISFGIDWDRDDAIRKFKDGDMDCIVLHLNIDTVPIIKGGYDS